MSDREQMIDFINQTTRKLGMPDIKFDDDDLDRLGRGEQLTFGQVKALAQQGGIVWVEYEDEGDEAPIRGAQRITQDDDSLFFQYGSFGMELELSEIIDKNDGAYFDLYDDYGHWRIFAAIEKPPVSLIDVANNLKNASIQIRAIAKRKGISDDEKAVLAKAILQVCLAPLQ